jgi:hypothetical protein
MASEILSRSPKCGRFLSRREAASPRFENADDDCLSLSVAERALRLEE